MKTGVLMWIQTGLLLWLSELQLTEAVSSNYPLFRKCPDECYCENNQAHCDTLSLTQMPGPFPRDLRGLKVRNNLIQRIEYKHLRQMHFLQHMMLKGNRIKWISSNAFRDLRDLVSLSLTENNIQKIMPGTFKHLGELRFLSLRWNKIKNVEGLFNRLFNLQLLNLAHNRIKKISHRTFKNNWRLTVLDLNDNNIGYIHKQAFRSMPFIKFLVLRDNPIKAVSLNFRPNTHLELLDLTNCQMSEMVQGLPYSITDIRLSENNITKIEAKDFKRTRRVRLLVLNTNQIETIEDKAFSKLLNLYDLYIGQNKLEKLPQKLPNNIHGIYANYNKIKTIQHNSFDGAHGLEFLYLHNNEITDIEQEAFWSLGNLRTLDLSSNMINQLRPQTFRGNKHLQKLDLSRNPLLKLEHDSLAGLESLHIFHMNSVGSRLDRSHIDPMIFQDMKKLLFLDVSNSSQLAQEMAGNFYFLEFIDSVEDLNLMQDDLQGLPSDFANHFPHLHMIKLVGNPWHCDMEILWLAHWMRNHTVEFFAPEHMICMSPPELYGWLIPELTEADLLPITRKKPVIEYIEISLKEYDLRSTNNEVVTNFTKLPYSSFYATKQVTSPESMKTSNMLPRQSRIISSNKPFKIHRSKGLPRVRGRVTFDVTPPIGSGEKEPYLVIKKVTKRQKRKGAKP